MNNLYFIWSEEHKAWWKPSSCGYIDSIYEAGKYTEDEAIDIVTNANKFIPEAENLHEVAISVDCVLNNDQSF